MFDQLQREIQLLTLTNQTDRLGAMCKRLLEHLETAHESLNTIATYDVKQKHDFVDPYTQAEAFISSQEIATNAVSLLNAEMDWELRHLTAREMEAESA